MVVETEVFLTIHRWRYPTANDFGSEIIPASAKEFNVQVNQWLHSWGLAGKLSSVFILLLLKQYIIGSDRRVFWTLNLCFISFLTRTYL